MQAAHAQSFTFGAATARRAQVQLGVLVAASRCASAKHGTQQPFQAQRQQTQHQDGGNATADLAAQRIHQGRAEQRSARAIIARDQL